MRMAGRTNRQLSIVLLVLAGASSSAAQTVTPQVFPNAPSGFDVRQPGIQSGRVERIEF
jgi:hypothetical protein